MSYVDTNSDHQIRPHTLPPVAKTIASKKAAIEMLAVVGGSLDCSNTSMCLSSKIPETKRYFETISYSPRGVVVL